MLTNNGTDALLAPSVPVSPTRSTRTEWMLLIDSTDTSNNPAPASDPSTTRRRTMLTGPTDNSTPKRTLAHRQRPKDIDYEILLTDAGSEELSD